MGVDTRAILNGVNGFEEIEDYLKRAFRDVKVHRGGSLDFIQISFLPDDGDRRLMSISGPSITRHTSGLSHGYHISLGCNDQSKEIISGMVGTFGGWYCEEDANEIWVPVRGMFCETNRIPYFYRWGVINGYITNQNSIPQLILAAEEWSKRYKSENNLIGN